MGIIKRFNPYLLSQKQLFGNNRCKTSKNVALTVDDDWLDRESHLGGSCFLKSKGVRYKEQGNKKSK